MVGPCWDVDLPQAQGWIIKGLMKQTQDRPWGPRVGGGRAARLCTGFEEKADRISFILRMDMREVKGEWARQLIKWRWC